MQGEPLVQDAGAQQLPLPPLVLPPQAQLWLVLFWEVAAPAADAPLLAQVLQQEVDAHAVAHAARPVAAPWAAGPALLLLALC